MYNIISCYNVMYTYTVPSLSPLDVVVTSVNPASLMVSWQLPPMIEDSNGSITGHIVKYARVGSSDVKSVNVTSGTTSTLSRLVPCVEYEVNVAAVNNDGTGPFSNPVVERSGENGKLVITVFKPGALRLACTLFCLRMSVCLCVCVCPEALKANKHTSTISYNYIPLQV